MIRFSPRPIIALCLALCATAPAYAADMKKLLVVSTTTGFRHSSISTIEKTLSTLGMQSGAFTVDTLRQPAETPGETGQQKDEAMKAAMQKLSPASLAKYDGVVFASTTGDLPIPDKAGFLAWIKSGKAFIGIHSAADTFHGWPEYREMLGGEFDTHGAQVGVSCRVVDKDHPATKHLFPVWNIAQEEIYQFKNYDGANSHELLVLDKHPQNGSPGHFPLAWTRAYGNGKVFYTALGHREDLIDNNPDLGDRKNSVADSEAYQKHLLGGVLWALGIEKGDNTPNGPKQLTAQWRPMLNMTFAGWEKFIGSPHNSVKDLPAGTPTSNNGQSGQSGPPLGLNKDPKEVFAMREEGGEPFLHVSGEIYGGLTTTESFSNYHFRTEFRWRDSKWAPRANDARDSGILYHATGEHGAFWNVWKSSLEYQIQEHDMGDLFCLAGTRADVHMKKDGNRYYYDANAPELRVGDGEGAVWSNVAHLVGDYEKPNWQWNTLEIYTIGRTAVHVVNGKVVLVLRNTSVIGPDKKEVPLDGGQIQIQCEGAEADYRRMEISAITSFPDEIKREAGI